MRRQIIDQVLPWEILELPYLHERKPRKTVWKPLFLNLLKRKEPSQVSTAGTRETICNKTFRVKTASQDLYYFTFMIYNDEENMAKYFEEENFKFIGEKYS